MKGVYVRTPKHIEELKLRMTGKRHSDASKKKMSLAQLGRTPWNKGKTLPHLSGENHHNWRGGKPHCIECDKKLAFFKAIKCKSCATKQRFREMSPETRLRLGRAISLRQVGKKMSAVSIEKNRQNHLGKKQSRETKEKRRKTFQSLSPERIKQWKDKISLALSGEKSYRWKGGISSENTKIRTSREYRYWREAVFQRDNYTCTICSLHSGNGRAVILNADHIKPFSLYPNLRFQLENGRTLCIDCHKSTDTYAGKMLKFNLNTVV